MSYILALDEGTTSARAILFGRGGEMKAIAQKEFTQHFPQPGWVEHDAEEIWSAQISVAIEALAKGGVQPSDVAAIGITNQRETTVLWERATGRPLHRALVWQDRRTAPWCDAQRSAGHAALIQQKTGLVVDAYFSASKIAWLLDHVPGARQRAERGELACGTIDAWLLWKLTGGSVHATDVTNASRTMLFNLSAGQWDDDLLQLFDIPRQLLPEVRSSSEVYGEVSNSLGLAGIPIAGIAGDQQAALFGQLCVTPGMVKSTYGTGCFLLQNTGREAVASQHQLLTTAAWRIDQETQYALEGSVFIGGAVVQWLRDGLGVLRAASDVERLASSVADNGGVCMVPAFAGLGAPHWDPHARGAVFGITRGTTAAHLARAALESIAFQVADLLDAMRADSGVPAHELRVDGGAAANNLLMQFQADLLQAPVLRPANTESTAQGAAYLAGLAVGFWIDVAELAAQGRVERRFEPQMKANEVERLRARWREALARAKHWEPTA